MSTNSVKEGDFQNSLPLPPVPKAASPFRPVFACPWHWHSHTYWLTEPGEARCPHILQDWRKTQRPHTNNKENVPVLPRDDLGPISGIWKKGTGLFLHNLLRCAAGPELCRTLWSSVTRSCRTHTERLVHSRAVCEQQGWEGSWSDPKPSEHLSSQKKSGTPFPASHIQVYFN